MGKSLLLFLLAVCFIACDQKDATTSFVSVWRTTGDHAKLLESSTEPFASNAFSKTIISIDTTQRFQTMDGFGYALTGGSAHLIQQKMKEEDRQNLLRELFDPINGIGISYLRISVGASDLDDHVFSYDDLAPREADPELKKFSIAPDQENLIPVLKVILKINPSVKIMASPWSAPVWMKDNQRAKGGSLLKKFYPAYANYFVKYLQAMKAEGIEIHTLTIQNEPENPNNTPSMLMTAEEQSLFIKENLGPALKAAGLSTGIVLFDHNADHPQYPISILNDSVTRKFVDGTAFHLYLGEVSALGEVRKAHPHKNLYFTEQWTSGKGEFAGDLQWHTKNIIVGATREGCKVILEWNLAADKNFNPHTDDGGCTLCQGAITVDSTITRNVSYYIIAHASKFVPAGSVRVESSKTDPLHHVAFVTPQGRKVIVVVNDHTTALEFTLQWGTNYVNTSLAAGEVATYVW